MIKSKRTPAHNLADKNHIARLKESGIKARKFMLDDPQSQCLRDVEAFIKKDADNIKLILACISK